jgi:DNA-binding MarR family transcriptional regulator
MVTTATQTTEVPWLDDREQQAWRSFIHTARLVMAALERGMAENGLTSTDYGVLVSLSEAPQRRLRMSELSQTLLLEKSRLSHQVTRMERAGLVRRESCPDDRRGQFAVLTDEGWETIRRVAPHHVELVRSIFIDRLTPAQLAQLTEMFTPLQTSIRAQCPKDEAEC